jgi:large subunit ribosomal protein L21
LPRRRSSPHGESLAAIAAKWERSRRDNMFAVIKTGGKQYKVAKNDVILVEKLEVEAGQDVTFDQILMVGEDTNLKVGAPLVKGASVLAKVLDQSQADKVLIFKKNRRHNYRRKRGHRQLQTVLRITDIKAA